MEYQMLRGRQPKELLRIPSPSGDWECQKQAAPQVLLLKGDEGA